MTKNTCFEKQRWGVIYRLTAPNGKCYIGQTIDFKRRMRDHRRGAKSPKYAVHHAIKKYGWVNIKKEIVISEVPEEDLDNLEQSYIEVENTLVPHGYNLKTCGERQVYSEASKKNMSESKKKHKGVGKGTITFSKKERKWKAISTKFKKKNIYVGAFNSREEAVHALSTFNISGDRDIRPKRDAGKGRISFSRGKYRVSLRESGKTHNIGSFKTKIEAENAITKFLETGETALKFERSKQTGNIQKRKNGRFRARYKQINIGTFDSEEEARNAIDEYLKEKK